MGQNFWIILLLALSVVFAGVLTVVDNNNHFRPVVTGVVESVRVESGGYFNPVITVVTFADGGVLILDGAHDNPSIGGGIRVGGKYRVQVEETINVISPSRLYELEPLLS